VTAKGPTDRAALGTRKEVWAELCQHPPHDKPVELTAGFPTFGSLVSLLTASLCLGLVGKCSAANPISGGRPFLARLQLAAEGSGVIGLALRRWRRQADATEFRQPTAAMTRWRVSALPSTPLPVPGVGRVRWRLELVRCRRGESACFEVEACDAQGRLALHAELGHGLLIHECADRRRDVFTPRSESLAGSVSRTFCAFICESW